MAFGDFVGNMGGVAIGMQEGELVRGRIREQNQMAEARASAIRQQQEQEAFNRMARRNLESAGANMRLDNGALPQAEQAGQYDGGAAPAANVTGGQKPPVKPMGEGTEDPYFAARNIYDAHVLADSQRLVNFRKMEQAARIRANPSEAERWRIAGDQLQERVVDYANARNSLGGPQEVQRDIRPQISDADKASSKKFVADNMPGRDADPKLYAAMAKPTQFDSMFSAAEKKYGLPEGVLKRLAYTESAFNPNAVNGSDGNGGSFGLMQINGQHFNGKLSREQIMDPATNIEFGARIFADAYKRSGGDIAKATQMYKGAVTAQGQARVAGAVSQVAGGSAPSAEGTPRQTQTAQPEGGAVPLFKGPDVSYGMKQLEDRFRYLQLALANTFESGEKLKLVQEMNDLQYRGRELQLQQLTQRAYTDDNALNQLVGLYTAGSGNPIGAQRLANGTIQLINQKGQAIAPPMTRQQLAVSLYNGVSDAQRNKNADLANKVREKAALTDAEAGAKHPYTMAQEQQKGVNSANTALIHAEGGIVRQQIEAMIRSGETHAPIMAGDAKGVVTVSKDGRRATYIPDPVRDQKTGIMVSGEPMHYDLTGGAVQPMFDQARFARSK